MTFRSLVRNNNSDGNIMTFEKNLFNKMLEMKNFVKLAYLDESKLKIAIIKLNHLNQL